MSEPRLDLLKGFILDLDGVLWRGGVALPGAAEFLKLLEADGRPYVVATNEPAYNPEELAERLNRLGFPVSPDRVLTAGMVAIEELQRLHSAGAQVQVIGTDSLKALVEEAGFVVGGGAVDALIVTMSQDVKMTELNLALQALNQGADFLAPNREMTYPTAEGVGAGDGMLVVALEEASGRRATVVGKPNQSFFGSALHMFDLPPAEVLVIGDNLETDIVGGQSAGASTALVLTGMTDREQLATRDVTPDWVFADIGELGHILSKTEAEIDH